MKVNREDLLRKLQSVAPGLAAREIVEQSSCYVFEGGRCITFNDEISCQTKVPLTFTGAVPAKPLTDLLSKLAEDEVDIDLVEGSLRVSGSGRRAAIRTEAEIALPVASVEQPEEWRKLSGEFCDAVEIVCQCASKDESSFALTCVHVTPDHVEACDNFQIARYPLDTGISAECLIRRESIKHIVGLGMIECSETPTWMHFRNASGLVLSCRRWLEDYTNLDGLMDVAGESVTLPGGLAESVDKAEIFSADNAESNAVKVMLKDGKMRLKGEGALGWYEEQKTVKYSGPAMSFLISPRLLADLTNRTNECVVTPGRLKIDAGKYKYVACLGAAD